MQAVYYLLVLFSAVSMLWKCIHGKSASVADWKTDKCISPRSESSATSFCFSNNFLGPILSLSNIRHDQSFVKQHNTNLCIWLVTKRLAWRNWTLESDRCTAQTTRTNYCMAVLPDPVAIFPKGVWARDYLWRWWCHMKILARIFISEMEMQLLMSLGTYLWVQRKRWGHQLLLFHLTHSECLQRWSEILPY